MEVRKSNISVTVAIIGEDFTLHLSLWLGVLATEKISLNGTIYISTFIVLISLTEFKWSDQIRTACC